MLPQFRQITLMSFGFRETVNQELICIPKVIHIVGVGVLDLYV